MALRRWRGNCREGERPGRRSAGASRLHPQPRGSRRPRSFFAEVRKAAKKAGYVGRQLRPGKQGRPRRSTFGRGRGAALRSGVLFGSSRRVVVRSRIIRHRGRTFRSTPLAAHVAYLKREEVTRDGEKARMFDSQSDSADDKGFAERCRDDRHHFRFIVSPQEATQMIDLKAFTRDLLADTERDLGTKLDWIAAEHWNTDDPHVHILIRGKAEDGRDLVQLRLQYLWPARPRPRAGHARVWAEELKGTSIYSDFECRGERRSCKVRFF